MAGHDYDVNYNDLASGANTLTKTAEEMNTILEKANKLMGETCEGDIFKGPAANYSMNAWNMVRNETQRTSNELVRTSNTVNTMNEYYQETDEKVGESVGKV
mgnify:CR=1 FL=1